MLMARACAILAPDALVVPNIDGKETFNLGSLARSNQIPFPTEKAHDAVEDVEAMRQLLARIKDQAPTLFDHLVRISGKETVLNLVQTHDYFRLSDYHFGKPVSRIMAAITRAPSNPNALAAFDLAHDPTEVLQMTEDQLQEALTASPRKIRVIALNAYPIISAVGAFSGEPRVAIASKILAERACLIHRDQDFQQRVARVMERRSAQTSRPAEPEYQNLAGFASDDDEALCARFHSIPWENRRAILDRIQDERLKGFALRLFYAERPDLLGERERQEIVAWQCDRILSDAAAPWMSAPKALERLAVMMKSTDPEVRRKLEIYVEQVARIRSVATQLPHGKRQKNAA